MSDHACSFEHMGRRCPALGSFKHAGGWKCRWHEKARSMMEAVAIMDDLLAHGEPKETDWRE